MTRRHWLPWTLLVGALCVSGCNSGGTQPVGPASDIVPSGGDGQNWYFNNPLPTPLSVTVLDPSGRPVPGVVGVWAVTSAPTSGAATPVQRTTSVLGSPRTNDSGA